VEWPQDQRLHVWAALAWPYLDTEPDANDWHDIAVHLRASPLEDSQAMRRVQRRVVAPIVRGQAFYGRWMPLAPSLDDEHTAAIESLWSSGAADQEVSLLRRLMWRSWTKKYWRRVDAELALLDR
jgi:hypothetical protein